MAMGIMYPELEDRWGQLYLMPKDHEENVSGSAYQWGMCTCLSVQMRKKRHGESLLATEIPGPECVSLWALGAGCGEKSQSASSEFWLEYWWLDSWRILSQVQSVDVFSSDINSPRCEEELHIHSTLELTKVQMLGYQPRSTQKFWWNRKSLCIWLKCWEAQIQDTLNSQRFWNVFHSWPLLLGKFLFESRYIKCICKSNIYW